MIKNIGMAINAVKTEIENVSVIIYRNGSFEVFPTVLELSFCYLKNNASYINIDGTVQMFDQYDLDLCFYSDNLKELLEYVIKNIDTNTYCQFIESYKYEALHYTNQLESFKDRITDKSKLESFEKGLFALNRIINYNVGDEIYVTAYGSIDKYIVDSVYYAGTSFSGEEIITIKISQPNSYYTTSPHVHNITAYSDLDDGYLHKINECVKILKDKKRYFDFCSMAFNNYPKNIQFLKKECEKL